MIFLTATKTEDILHYISYFQNLYPVYNSFAGPLARLSFKNYTYIYSYEGLERYQFLPRFSYFYEHWASALQTSLGRI